jgi:hypothetical protein
LLESEEGFHTVDVQRGSTPLYDSVKNLLHLTCSLEQEVARVFELIHRVLVLKVRFFLFSEVETETNTGVDPVLANLDQAPYSVFTMQGICDFLQACEIVNLSKAVALLCKAYPAFSGLRSYVLMAVEKDLSPEGRVPRHFNGEVSPVGVQNMERVVVYVGPRFLFFQVSVGGLNLPYGRGCARDKNQKNSPAVRVGGQVFFCNEVLTLAALTVNEGYAFAFGPTVQTSAEPSGHSHEVIIVQVLIMAMKSSPPGTKASSPLAHGIIGVQHNAVHTVVESVEQVAVILAEWVCGDHIFPPNSS